jgi:hypothetical protein
MRNYIIFKKGFYSNISSPLKFIKEDKSTWFWQNYFILERKKSIKYREISVFKMC